jgi:multidrug efflux pump subunit AcrA (membrane-fusion protein)
MRNATAILALLFAAAIAVPSHARECESLVYVDDHTTTTTNDCDAHLNVERLRAQYGKHFAVASRGFHWYLITDAAVLRQIGDAYKAQTELGSRQAALGAQQAALGSKQAALGAEQARIALSGDHEAQSRLSERQSELGRLQAQLGQQQSELGRQQEEAGRAAERKVATLLTEAIRTGAAKEIR